MRHLSPERREYGEQGVCLAVGAGRRCTASLVVHSLPRLQLPLHPPVRPSPPRRHRCAATTASRIWTGKLGGLGHFPESNPTPDQPVYSSTGQTRKSVRPGLDRFALVCGSVDGFAGLAQPVKSHGPAVQCTHECPTRWFKVADELKLCYRA